MGWGEEGWSTRPSWKGRFHCHKKQLISLQTERVGWEHGQGGCGPGLWSWRLFGFLHFLTLKIKKKIFFSLWFVCICALVGFSFPLVYFPFDFLDFWSPFPFEYPGLPGLYQREQETGAVALSVLDPRKSSPLGLGMAMAGPPAGHQSPGTGNIRLSSHCNALPRADPSAGAPSAQASESLCALPKTDRSLGPCPALTGRFYYYSDKVQPSDQYTTATEIRFVILTCPKRRDVIHRVGEGEGSTQRNTRLVTSRRRQDNCHKSLYCGSQGEEPMRQAKQA